MAGLLGSALWLTLVMMTSKAPSVRSMTHGGAGRWRLADAKARFSELVRKARTDGPQTVTVRGQEEVVVVAAEDYRRLLGEPSGAALVEAFAASPHREIELGAPEGVRSPIRPVDLG